MSNNAPDYKNNLVFEPSMPRCDIEELQNKLAHSEKMRDLQAEYACKLEEKLRIAEQALEYYAKRQYLHFEEPDFQKSFFNYYDEENDCEVWVEGGKIAKEALNKIND